MKNEIVKKEPEEVVSEAGLEQNKTFEDFRLRLTSLDRRVTKLLQDDRIANSESFVNIVSSTKDNLTKAFKELKRLMEAEKFPSLQTLDISDGDEKERLREVGEKILALQGQQVADTFWYVDSLIKNAEKTIEEVEDLIEVSKRIES